MDEILCIIQQIVCENSLSIFLALFVLIFICIFIMFNANKKRKRFLVWKKEEINLWVYKNSKEYGKDDILQELYDDNTRLDAENKILKNQVSNSSFWGIVLLFIVVIALWIKRNKDTNQPENRLKKL